jgi:DNA topoisomerase-3
VPAATTLLRIDYRGQVMRVLFTAQDSQIIRDAFGRAKPNSEYARLYAAAVARRQADQIYNLSLTRTATVILGRGARRVIGVGRVKTPTLAIVCKPRSCQCGPGLRGRACRTRRG